MLLWISAAGLAGAGYLGWLVWQDYDWGTVRLSARTVEPVNQSRSFTGYANQTTQRSTASDEDDLLGATQTNWGNVLDSPEPDHPQSTDNKAVHTVTSAPVEQADNVPEPEEPETTRPSARLDQPQPEEPEQVAVQPDAARPNAARPSAIHEDFVVVEPRSVLASVRVTSDVNAQLSLPNEDFVVVGEGLQQPDDELPEVDLTDYLGQWTPIVPKIAALITHELWPQLRSYLSALPQFGDANLERVVNAVADETTTTSGETGGVGEESATGFAFYAALFEQLDIDDPVAEPILIGA